MSDNVKSDAPAQEFERVVLSPDAQKARNGRNLWLGIALIGFVVLIGTITIIRITQGIGVSERM